MDVLVMALRMISVKTLDDFDKLFQDLRLMSNRVIKNCGWLHNI